MFIKSVHDINCSTEEGKLLIAAIGILMGTETRTTKTPEDIIAELSDIAKNYK